MIMMNDRARRYADEATGDEIETSDYLKIYHAYEDGWQASEPEKGINSYIFLGMFIGIFFGVILATLINNYVVKIFV